MTNGFHAHYCPICKVDWPCPKVTHCNNPAQVICFEPHTKEALQTFMELEAKATGETK